jgi:hypothetical protein
VSSTLNSTVYVKPTETPPAVDEMEKVVEYMKRGVK